MQGRIQLGRLLRIDFIQTLGDSASLAAIKKLSDGRSIQLTAGHTELVGRSLCKAEKIVGK
jgi:hypothetical protein